MWFLVLRLTRSTLPLCSALAAWIVSRACGSDSITSAIAATAIGLSTLAASFYHYGGQDKMYARKAERLEFSDPQLLMLTGLTIFSLSIAVSVAWLPKACTYTCLFNTVAITAYSHKLSSHWATKNLTIGIVCMTPVYIGWQAGTTTHPLVPWALGTALLSQVAREMVKDVQDIVANEGIRVTLPMVLGTQRVLQIAGLLLLGATATLVGVLQFTEGLLQQLMVLASAVIFIFVARELALYRLGKSQTAITAGLLFVLIALL